jgi:hypothetical protein
MCVYCTLGSPDKNRRNGVVSSQNRREFNRTLINDPSRQLASYLDQCALYGGGPAANQPTGLINLRGVAQGGRKSVVASKVAEPA